MTRLATLAAQETTGSITGVVKDSTGAIIVGASVTAVNQENGAEFRSATDPNGAYQFPLLRAGTYRLTVESKGFQRVQQMVVVNTSERPRIDVTLSVGQVTDTVNVTAETPLLQSEKSTIGQVVEQRTIQSIPLATRNFTQILGTSAGVVGSVFNADNPGTGSDSVSVNGARRGSNNLLVDGVPTTNPLNNAPDGDGTPSAVSRSQPLTVTWRGGAPGGFVIIQGGSFAGSNAELFTSFGCTERSEAGRYTVPRDVLASMVSSNVAAPLNIPTGSLLVQHFTLPARFTATGLEPRVDCLAVLQRHAGPLSVDL